MFESLVNSEGRKTNSRSYNPDREFESLVNSEGRKTKQINEYRNACLRALLIQKDVRLDARLIYPTLV